MLMSKFRVTPSATCSLVEVVDLAVKLLQPLLLLLLLLLQASNIRTHANSNGVNLLNGEL